MRILQLVTRRQRRGAEVFATELADTLTHRGHVVLVLGLYEPPAEPLTPVAAARADVGGQPKSPLNLRTFAQLIIRIREFKPDLVQANGSDTLKYSTLAKRVARGRWPLIYRNISLASHWLRGPAQRAWVRWLVAAVDHVVSVSDASAADFVRTYGVARDRVTAIPRAVRIPPHDIANEARARLVELANVPDGAPVLAHVGSFTAEKNHGWLLEAFERVRAGAPDPHLVLMGDGPLRKDVEAEVARRGLQSRVHLLGSRADAGELVAGADLFVLTSLVEGIPGVLLEAAAHRVPAVATDVGGVRQAVRTGVSGLVVRSGDLDGFVAGVCDLLADPERRRQMGDAARQLVEQEFELEAVADRYDLLYRALVGGAAG